MLLLLPEGRDAFCEALNSDALECFRRCGALERPPTNEIVAWLDELASVARAEVDAVKLSRGREAERKSFEWERQRLSAITGAPAPEWVSLDNNGAGYDIRSFESKGEPHITYVPRLIEVKASTASKPQFYLSQNEVRTARSNPNTYFLHIWSPSATAPLVIPWAELNSHIPSDTEIGESTEVFIRWPQW